MSFLAPLIKSAILDGIKPSWKKILLSPAIKPKLYKCFELLEQDLLNKGVTAERVAKNGLGTYIRPAPENIFAPYKLIDAHNLRGLCIGQDPFPDQKDAHGISFSSKDSHTPASLAKIFATLKSQGLLTKDPVTNDLTGWCEQGILMINAYLTRTPNIVRKVYRDGAVETVGCSVEGNGGSDKKCLHAFWEDFTLALLEYLSGTYYPPILVAQKRNIYVMLWGNAAKSLQHRIVSPFSTENGERGERYGFKILTWSHPSPMVTANHDASNPENFIKCDHFARIKTEYPDINWDPGFTTTDDLSDRFWSYRATKPSGLGLISTRSCHNELQAVLATNSAFEIYDDGTSTPENLQIKKYIDEKLEAKKMATLAVPAAPAAPAALAAQAPQTEPPKARKRIVVFTDGACKGNGTANPKGAVGVYFAPTFEGETTITGEHKIAEKLSTKTQAYNKEQGRIVDTATDIKNTNQRAEMMAVVRALEYIVNLGGKMKDVENVLMVTDSLEYVHKWTTEMLWREYAIDSKFAKVNNRDLIVLLCRYVWLWARILKPDCSFNDSQDILIKSGRWTVEHVRSHQNISSLTGRAAELATGNDIADTLCSF